MSKHVIRNYGPPREIPGVGTIAYDGVIETNDSAIAVAAGSMDAMNVVTRPDGKGAIPKPAEPAKPAEGSPLESTQEGTKPFDEMTVAELKAAAAEAGIELPKRILKADLLKLLLEAN